MADVKRKTALAILLIAAMAASAERAFAQGEDPRPADEIVRALDN